MEARSVLLIFFKKHAAPLRFAYTENDMFQIILYSTSEHGANVSLQNFAPNQRNTRKDKDKTDTSGFKDDAHYKGKGTGTGVGLHRLLGRSGRY